MTDQEIIQGLIDKDSGITQEFFFERCKPLFHNIIHTVFGGCAQYEELVNELYLYLMENDAEKLRSFSFRSSVYHWLKILAIRFFVRLRDKGKVIDNNSHEPLYEESGSITEPHESAHEDLKRLLQSMHNKRYAMVVERLIIDDAEPETLASEMGITTVNLYNLKKRAIRQLTITALNDIHYYGRP